MIILTLDVAVGVYVYMDVKMPFTLRAILYLFHTASTADFLISRRLSDRVTIRSYIYILFVMDTAEDSA